MVILRMGMEPIALAAVVFVEDPSLGDDPPVFSSLLEGVEMGWFYFSSAWKQMFKQFSLGMIAVFHISCQKGMVHRVQLPLGNQARVLAGRQIV
jgi:hypothetical protein